MKKELLCSYKPVLAISILIFILGCDQTDQFNPYIEKIKSTYVETLTGTMKVNDLVAETAGMEGSAKWKAFVPSGYSDNVVCVQVDIVRGKKVHNLITLQFFINRDTDLVNFQHISVDKKALSLLAFEEVRAQMLLSNLKK